MLMEQETREGAVGLPFQLQATATTVAGTTYGDDEEQKDEVDED